MSNSFSDIKKRIGELNKYLGLTTKEIDYLLTPERVINKEIILKKDNSTVDKLMAYRVQFNSVLGPTKGGIRFHHEVDLDEVKSLAFWMGLKCSLAGLPYGGAKGGVVVNPKHLSYKEVESLSRAFIRDFAGHIGPYKDIPAPDVYTTPQIMAWMMDEYEKILGEHQPGVITGKPVILGGSLGRDSSTAQGGVYVLLAAMEKLDIDPNTAKVVIQGFGNAGMNAAEILHKEGIRIVGVSDSEGGIYNEDGLDIPLLAKHKKGGSAVSAFKGGKKITNAELLETDADVLIPAALANAITAENAAKVKVRLILELANGPVTSDADSILHKNDVIVVPDILANSGGVIVSYYEWVQNNTGEYWEEQEVLAKLKKRIILSFDKMYKLMREKDVDMRTAAYILAIRRIIEAARLRGRV